MINHKPKFSKATMRVARAMLKELEAQSDEAFLIRVGMGRRLDSLGGNG